MLTMESPLGPLTLTARHNRLVSILFGEARGGESSDPVLHDARRQLRNTLMEAGEPSSLRWGPMALRFRSKSGGRWSASPSARPPATPR